MWRRLLVMISSSVPWVATATGLSRPGEPGDSVTLRSDIKSFCGIASPDQELDDIRAPSQHEIGEVALTAEVRARVTLDQRLVEL